MTERLQVLDEQPFRSLHGYRQPVAEAKQLGA